jgi:FkbM family methyltransferase
MLKHNEELALCAQAHYDEVIVNDSYKVKELAERDPNIEYIVDIGGNLGASGLQFHTFFPNAKIILCEPEDMLMSYAKENTNNELIYVEKAVIGDPRIKEVTFNICKWQGNHHVAGKFDMSIYGIPEVGSEIIGQRIVPAITLTQIIHDNNFPRIDLLKIDTEGSEGDILQGFAINLAGVKHIIGEFHSQKDLALIKSALEETHEVTYVDGAFKQPDGQVANGGFFAELRPEYVKA